MSYLYNQPKLNLKKLIFPSQKEFLKKSNHQRLSIYLSTPFKVKLLIKPSILKSIEFQVKSQKKKFIF